MSMKEFLEKSPLYKSYKADSFLVVDRSSALSGTMFGGGGRPVRYTIDSPAINFVCPVCKSIQTYNMRNEPEWFLLPGTLPMISKMEYVCDSCKYDQRSYFVMLSEVEESVKRGEKVEKVKIIKIQKIGQYPAWSIDLDKNLADILGEHSDFYKKGLVCESQSYGIGAYSYFRRITEDVIDTLLDSIFDLIEKEDEREAYKCALEETKKTRVTQEKVDLVKDLLPASLRPEGINPLGILHSALSEGLHGLSDEKCMEKAESIRDVLVFLVNQTIVLKQSSKKFTDGMKRLLEKNGK